MIKTMTFAILHFAVAFSVAYVLTGSIAISSTVALVEPIVNTVAFFFHEKAWQRFERQKQMQQVQIEVANQNRRIEETPQQFCCDHHKLYWAATQVSHAMTEQTPKHKVAAW